MSQPFFTVATITYNSEKWINFSITSILASSFKDFELIISDDCSSDNTWKIISGIDDSRIVRFQNPENIGEYNNRNEVLKKAKGKYIIYIDGDDIIYKNSLEIAHRYLISFPNAKSMWGVYPLFFDFIVFPYILDKEEITRLNFLSAYPISLVGFAETFFEIETLKNIGGFTNKYSLGDTFIKRRLACEFSVLLVPAGFTFWRQTENQASNKVKKNLHNLIDTLLIDKEILNNDYFPLKGKDLYQAKLNYRIRSIKLIVKNTLLKLKILEFFRLIRILKIPITDLLFLFSKGDYTYKVGGNGEKPLMNDYNFLDKTL